jgi:urease alpha subunit
MYDLLIKNGTVIDGTGAPRFMADVAVKDGKIAKIAAKIEEGVQNEFWMCCIPTRVVLVQAGNYLIAMYGQDAVEYFLNVTLDTIDGAKVLIDNPISR